MWPTGGTEALTTTDWVIEELQQCALSASFISDIDVEHTNTAKKAQDNCNINISKKTSFVIYNSNSIN